MDIKLDFKRKGYSKEYDIICGNEISGKIFLVENDSLVNIESLYIDRLNQRKGIGKRVINKLKVDYGMISGCSSPFAIGFWLKMGATFEYEVCEEMIHDLLSMGEFPSFIIEC